MGKVIERIRLTSALDPRRSVELDAVVDTGATMLVLPIEIVERLGLKKVRDVRVRYANGGSEPKGIYGIVNVEIKGRAGNFDVIAEAEGTQPLIGQIVLEELDLVVDPRSRLLVPNPSSPDMPMLEIL
jgi:clan AA aspartic protease